MPAELDEAERQIRQLEIEREALRKEQDQASQQRLQALERQLAELAEQRNSLRARWEQEKAAIGRLNKAALDDVVYAPTGFFLSYTAWRKNVSGIAKGPLPFFWGVSKSA